MVAKFTHLSGSVNDTEKIRIEFETLKGFPDFNILGVSSVIGNNLKHKLKSIITNSGFKYPGIKKIATFFPSAKDKFGYQYDLPISLGFLKSTNQIRYDFKSSDLFLGELSLDGSSNSVSNIVSKINSAKQFGFKNIFIPKQNYSQLVDFKGVNIIAYSSLKDLVHKLNSFDYPETYEACSINNELNFDTIQDNLFAKRILSICVGSFSNVLLVGFPGIGKSLLLNSIKSILPKPNKHFQKYQLDKYPLNIVDPTITKSDLIGSKNKSGLFQSSNFGVLAVNELPDISKKVLDVLKGPIEEKQYTNKLTKIPFQASFIATMNPCKCGYLNSTTHECKCNSYSQSGYINKIGVPFYDRFDAFIDLTNNNNPKVETSGKTTQTERAITLVSRLRDYQSISKQLISNMSLYDLDPKTTEKSKLLMSFISKKLNLSPRRQVKILRLALSLSVSEGRDSIGAKHVYEALSYQDYFFKNVLPQKK